MANARCGGIEGGRGARLADPWHLKNFTIVFFFAIIFQIQFFWPYEQIRELCHVEKYIRTVSKQKQERFQQ